jgi:hypothetical protein
MATMALIRRLAERLGKAYRTTSFDSCKREMNFEKV